MTYTAKRTATVTAQGKDITEVVAHAYQQLDAYHAGYDWRITEVRARPLVHSTGSPIPELWEADIEAEAT